MMRLSLATCLMLFFGAARASAQGGDALDCMVSVVAAGSHGLGVRELGEFNAATTNQMTTRSFGLLDTGLFVIAAVSTDTESQPSRGSAKRVSLTLIVSRRAQPNPRRLDFREVLHVAGAEVGPKNLEGVKVSTLVQRRGRRWVVEMSCQAGTQP